MISEWIGSDRVGYVIDARFPLQRWLGGADESGVFLTRIGGEAAQNAAIKIIPAGIVDPESLVAQWVASKRLIHQHLIQLFHAGTCRMDDCDLLYAVTDVADEVLSEVLPVRALSPTEVREMLHPILDALSWLHSQGLVHGGLKPSNVMVVNEQINLSVDRVQPAGPRIFPVLSPDIHDAPESAGKITPAADVWSIGVLIVEALTQRPPRWDGTRLAGPRIPATVPQPFAAIASECLRLDPASRCSLTEVKSHLSRARVVTLPGSVSRPSSPVRPPAALSAASPAGLSPKPPEATPARVPEQAEPKFETLPPGFIPVIAKSSVPPLESAPAAESPAPAGVSEVAEVPPASEPAAPEGPSLAESTVAETPPVTLEAPLVPEPPAPEGPSLAESTVAQSPPAVVEAQSAATPESEPLVVAPVITPLPTPAPESESATASPIAETSEPSAPPLAAEALPPDDGPAEAMAESAPKPPVAEAPGQPALVPPPHVLSQRRAPAAPTFTGIPAPPPVADEVKPSSNRRATLVAAAMVLVAAGLTLMLALHLSHSSSSPRAKSPKIPPAAPAAAQATTAPAPAAPAQKSPVPASPVSASGVPTGPVTPGAVLHQVLPDVTQHAMDTIAGRLVVIVLAQVDANGNVSSATYDYAGNSHYLKTAALAAAQNWKFRPAQIGGQPVPSTWDLLFWFDQSGPTVTAKEKTP